MQYTGIICVSGDGIIHEVVNAIFHRREIEEFNITIGVIPAGSGNGLAKSISDSLNEEYDIKFFAFLICKGLTKKMDLLEINKSSDNKKIYSFLSVAWGIISDIDLESEVY